MPDVLKLLANDTLCDLTGNRLWLDDIQRKPGLCAGRCSYITFCSITAPHLVQIQFALDGQSSEAELLDYRWSIAGIEAAYSCGKMHIREKKYITREDVFAVVLSVRNADSVSHEFALSASTLLSCVKSHFRSLYNPAYVEFDNAGTHAARMRLMLDVTARNVLRTVTQANIVFYSPQLCVDDGNDSFGASRRLQPGECADFTICGMISHVDPLESLLEKTMVHAEGDLWQCNERVVAQWFDENVPAFSCSDPVLEKLYYYRWYLVYKNMITPEIDCFRDLCMYEGKDQFSLVCSASAPMHIREMRWLKDPAYVMSEMKTLLACQLKEGRDQGRLRDLYLSDLPAAIWETSCLLPDAQRRQIADNREAVLRYTAYQHSKRYVPSSFPLPVVVGSWRTAAEYQPSFFEFTQPQWDHELSNPFGKEHMTQLHRVDDATHLCRNMAAVSRLYRAAQETETADEYAKRSRQVQQSILQEMWDEQTQFFYDLCPADRRKALQSKNFAGFLGARIDPSQANREALMDHLTKEFSAPYPIPTAARDCPAFAPDNTWRIGPHASEDHPYSYDCCWNGPTWNFGNALVIDTLGEIVQDSQTRKHEALFAELFGKWCLEQCPGPDAVPNTCEHYNPFTGEELRAVRDYAHSTFIDILMRRVVGIRENEQGALICQPLNLGLARLTVRGIPYRGHSVDFCWNRDHPVPLQVFVDQQLICTSDQLSDFAFDLEKNGA